MLENKKLNEKPAPKAHRLTRGAAYYGRKQKVPYQSSTSFCSQYADNEWYNQLSGDDNHLAEAILDCIIHDAYRIDIRSITLSNDV